MSAGLFLLQLSAVAIFFTKKNPPLSARLQRSNNLVFFNGVLARNARYLNLTAGVFAPRFHAYTRPSPCQELLLWSSCFEVRRIANGRSGMAGRKRSLSWDRTEVVRCHCNELLYTHVHCPCSSCSGKPVSTSVEYRHWQLQNSLESKASNGVSTASTSTM